jgi:hypothetical protein
MKKDIAYTMDCPFVARKCKADKCMAWEKFDRDNNEGHCLLLFALFKEISDITNNKNEI